MQFHYNYWFHIQIFYALTFLFILCGCNVIDNWCSNYRCANECKYCNWQYYFRLHFKLFIFRVSGKVHKNSTNNKTIRQQQKFLQNHFRCFSLTQFVTTDYIFWLLNCFYNILNDRVIYWNEMKEWIKCVYWHNYNKQLYLFISFKHHNMPIFDYKILTIIVIVFILFCVLVH